MNIYAQQDLDAELESLRRLATRLDALFTIPGIGVHDTLEWVFTMGWNQRSGSPEYTHRQ